MKENRFSKDKKRIVYTTHRRISSDHEDLESRRQVDVLIAQGDEHSASRSLDFSIQDRVEDRVVALDVLHQQRVAESKGRFQVLSGSASLVNFKESPIPT